MNADTMPLEMDTRVLIDHSLESLGWKLSGGNQNVYFERTKTEAERKKLGGKRPDYVLYSDEKPLIVIEAKKKGSRIDAALEQGIGYARAIDAPLVFATDGVFCKTFHTVANRPPILNGEEVDEFIREALAVQFLTSYEVNTVSPKVQYDRRELIRIFDEANNMLRGDGHRAGIERFGEFANILFLKLISENEQIKKDSNIKSDFDIASCSWDSIKNIASSARIEYINNTVYPRLNKLYNTEIFTQLNIHDDIILKEIMDKLDPLTLTDVDSDVKGDAFEYFLRASTATKNDLGEYFTPRHIVKTMVRLINPKIGEKIYDPFCGTGGFLIESFRHIERNMGKSVPELKRILREETIYGNEITNTARITKMNMILAGDGHSNIHKKDSLAKPTYVEKIKYDDEGNIVRDKEGNIEYLGEYSGLYDVVITNMPYSQKTKHGKLYDLPSANGDSICVQHCIKAVKCTADNGRMALVVPEGFLFRKDMAKTREYLLDRCQLQSIISLPQGVFLPYTGVKTDIIYATKVNQKIKTSEKKKDFWYFDVKSDGYTLDNHRRKLDTPSDLNKYEEYRKLDEEQTEDMLKVGFEIVPLDEVRRNSFILVGSRYRENIVRNEKSVFAQYPLKEVCQIIAGQSPKGEHYNKDKNGLPFYQGNINFGEVYIKAPTLWTSEVTKEAFDKDILLSVRAPVGEANICNAHICIGRGLAALRPLDKIDHRFLFYLLKWQGGRLLKAQSMGSTFEGITKKDIENFVIPVPSLDIQTKLVDVLDRYQQIILGAQKVVDNYKPVFPIDPSWPVKELGDICSFEYGYTDIASNTGDTRYVRITDINSDGSLSSEDSKFINLTEDNKKYLLNPGDILVARIGATFGKTLFFEGDHNAIFASYLIRLKLDKCVLPKYYFYYAQSDDYWRQARELVTGAGQPQFNANTIRLLKIPVPPIKEQRRVIAELEEEKALIQPSKTIISVFTEKIKKKMQEVWGEKI